MTEAAWAASRTKDSAYSAIYHNIARRRGKKRALVAVAHRLLIDIYRILKTGESYQEIGAEVVYERSIKRREKSMIRSLERAGYTVTKEVTA